MNFAPSNSIEGIKKKYNKKKEKKKEEEGLA